MTTGSIFGFIVFACVGGAILFVGLLMERFSEKDWHTNIGDFRRSKSRKVVGEWLVIGGVLIETLVAGFAAKDEWKAKPENQQIAKITASVFLMERGTNRTNVDPNKTPTDAVFIQLALQSSENLKTNASSWAVGLTCSSFRRFEMQESGETDWFLEFDSTGIGHIWSVVPNISLGNANEFDTIVISAPFLPENAEIIGGDVTLTINSSKRKFDIPPQKVNGSSFQLKSVTVLSW